jgi:hypothetical protein
LDRAAGGKKGVTNTNGMEIALAYFRKVNWWRYLPNKTPWLESASDRRWSAKLVTTFSHTEVLRGQHNGCLRTYSRFSRPEPLLFLPSSSSTVLTRLSGPRSRTHYFSEKSGSAGNRTRTFGSVARSSDH